VNRCGVLRWVLLTPGTRHSAMLLVLTCSKNSCNGGLDSP